MGRTLLKRIILCERNMPPEAAINVGVVIEFCCDSDSLAFRVTMASHVTPGTRNATSDWFVSNYTISTNAERQRQASHDTRQEANYLRNETGNKTKWDQYDNNTRLSDRVDHIRKWVLLVTRWLWISSAHIWYWFTLEVTSGILHKEAKRFITFLLSLGSAKKFRKNLSVSLSSQWSFSKPLNWLIKFTIKFHEYWGHPLYPSLYCPRVMGQHTDCKRAINLRFFMLYFVVEYRVIWDTVCLFDHENHGKEQLSCSEYRWFRYAIPSPN